MLHKVICIDDDPIALLLSKLVLSKSDIAADIVTLPNGLEAISYLENPENIEHHKNSEFPILILLDLNMPVMDGWEFLEQFKKKLYTDYKNAKIILLSSSIDPSDIQKSKEFEMVLEFFPKPLTREMLAEIAQKLNNA
jgi:CheY-like chemotaxis protein